MTVRLVSRENGQWLQYKHYVSKKLLELNAKPGDILVRLGDAHLFRFIWFSKIIANVTNSLYSHAALVIENTKQDVILADVTFSGLRRQFIEDWCSNIRGNSILLLRYRNDNNIPTKAAEIAKSLLKENNSLFTNKNFYCVELINWCFSQVGINLCDPVPLKHMEGWKPWMQAFRKLYQLKNYQPIYCVGNNKYGLLSSNLLETIGKIDLPKTANKKIMDKKQFFQGA